MTDSKQGGNIKSRFFKSQALIYKDRDYQQQADRLNF